MGFTVAEKLQLVMLCDLAKPLKEREIDPDFVFRAVVNDDLWALSWRYSGLDLKVATPPDVSLVLDILEMWERLEEAYAKLSPAQKSAVKKESHDSLGLRFPGFDGNNETELLHIARLLIEDLDRFSTFKGRGLNSHSMGIDGYRRMLEVWRPLWGARTRIAMSSPSAFDFSAEEIASVMRERIHPSYREAQPDGTWIYKPAEAAPR